jgi:hypothetical protein
MRLDICAARCQRAHAALFPKLQIARKKIAREKLSQEKISKKILTRGTVVILLRACT